MGHRHATQRRRLIAAAGLLAMVSACGEESDSAACSSLAASGQTRSYQGGDDGSQRRGRPLALRDNHDGTVSDRNSGLMWEKKWGLDGVVSLQNLHDADNCYPWSGACSISEAICGTGADCPSGETCRTTDCQTPLPSGLTIFGWVERLNSSRFAGYTDWRIPNIKELHSLVDYGAAGAAAVGPALDGEACGVSCLDPAAASCSCTKPGSYWSSTSIETNAAGAWRVFFEDGQVGGKPKDGVLSIRAVRGGT